eukprot:PITA_12698
MHQPVATIPLPQPTLPALQQNPQSNLRQQLPAQPNPNPNNRPVQSVQNNRNTGNRSRSEGVEQLLQEEDVNKQQIHNQATASSPPFPEWLVISRPIQYPDFDILGELKNLYIKIPFLQAIQDILIYAKNIKEFCVKKPRRNIANNPRVQVVGTLSNLLSGKETLIKYEDPGNPIVTVQIYGQTFSNALVDLGAAINILTTTTCQKLGITSVEPTSTLLELANQSMVRPEGTLHDIMVSVDSWEYPTNFLIINPKNRLDGHPLILGRPWLAIVNGYIGCRQGNMTITRGENIKNLALYPPVQPSVIIMKTNKHPVSYLTDNIRSPLTIQEALDFKDHTEDDAINNFISQTKLRSYTECHMIEAAFDNELEEDPLKETHDQTIPVTSVANSKIVEIEPGKTLKINANLTSEQEEKLIQLLRKYKEAFAWDYPDMKGIDPQICTHHIYIEKDARPVYQPQRRLNPHLKEVVKAELQKLLDVNFIYPISDSKWVSPLVVVPKKNGKWRICVDYRELNKATQKDHFPLPFIDQVLDTLAGKKFFSFLDGFSGYNQIQISPEDQDKTTFTCPWGTFAYRVLPFGLCNAPATFQRAILSIFVDLINEGLEVYMDDFIAYRDDFNPALHTLEKVLQCCIATRLCLSHEKCYMMMTKGLILGHYISAAGIQVDPAKIQIILLIPTPTTQTEVHSFLAFTGYYRRFIEHFSHIVAPMSALTENVDFLWTEKCERAFQDLKKLVSTAPVLRGPNWDLSFQISLDASDTTIGAVLGQEEDKKPYAIYYVSKNLSLAELNYTVTEKEFLVVIHVVNKFRHYITGYLVILYTDHSTIKYLAKKPITNGRITRWLILLQEFDITIKDRPGKENPVADFLSRMPKPIDAAAVEDQFPDEHLFAVVVKTPWYANVANYLAMGKLSKHLTPNERKQIIQRSAQFS